MYFRDAAREAGTGLGGCNPVNIFRYEHPRTCLGIAQGCGFAVDRLRRSSYSDKQGSMLRYNYRDGSSWHPSGRVRLRTTLNKSARYERSVRRYGLDKSCLTGRVGYIDMDTMVFVARPALEHASRLL